MKEKNKGITLIALVITIIILLILAGVTIGQLTGNGLFEKIWLAKEKSDKAQQEENGTLEDYENKINEYINGTRQNIEEKILWEGITNEIKTYDLKDDIKNYNYLYIQYQEGDSGIAKGGELLKVKYITKTINTDERITSFENRAIHFHFIDNGFVVDRFEGNPSPYITAIIGIN